MESADAWANQTVKRILQLARSGGDPASEPIKAPSGEHDDRLMHAIWELDLGDEDEQLVTRVLAALLRSDLLSVRAGAMFALFDLGHARKHIGVYREGATSEAEGMRDASAYGLGCSDAKEDEDLLWKLLHDCSSEVRVSAAYSLRDMPREIDESRFHRTIKSLKYDSHLILAERALKDRRLFAVTRDVLRRKWRRIEEVGWAGWFDEYPKLFGFAAT